MLILLICAVLAVAIAAPATDTSPVQILRYENEPLNSENRYKFNYELSDGQRRTEEGEFLPSINDQSKKSLFVTGSYEFVAPDGQVYYVMYTADENGFHPVTSPASGFGTAAPPAFGLSPNAVASLIG